MVASAVFCTRPAVRSREKRRRLPSDRVWSEDEPGFRCRTGRETPSVTEPEQALRDGGAALAERPRRTGEEPG